MSRDFANFMESMKEQPLEDQMSEISDILTKVMAIVVSAIDDITQRMSTLEQTLQNNAIEINTIKSNVANIQQNAAPLTPQPQATPGLATPPPPPPPKPAPKPMSPLSARSAINSELKALFNKRKR